MITFGLCCIFREQPISYRHTTASYLKKMPRDGQLVRISSLCLENMKSVTKALSWLYEHNIFAYRVPSPLLPRYTHPEVGYTLDDLPDRDEILKESEKIRKNRKKWNIRLSLHPDQFNVLSSPHQHVVDNTIRELEYQGTLAQLLGAEVINVHCGGKYGSKTEALDRLRHNFMKLSSRVQSRLTFENDDISYTPSDLIGLCRSLKVPFVYDVHHHRCLPDSLTIEEATFSALQSWDDVAREPYFHISSPLNGYQSSNPRPHADYISSGDMPSLWLEIGKQRDLTIDVEAKAKELAIMKLQDDLC